MPERHKEYHLARSLMSKPDLLLLDEPFSNVDESLKVELQQNIKKILKEKMNNYNHSNA